MRLQTRKPQKLKEKLIGNHKETQNTLKISGLFHFTRLVSYFKDPCRSKCQSVLMKPAVISCLTEKAFALRD